MRKQETVLVLISLVAVSSLIGCTSAAPSEPATAPSAAREAPVQVIDKAGGEDLYVRFCASCHGVGGQGDGPASEALRVATTDLTQLTKGGGEPFPTIMVQEAIQGPRPGVHGEPEMPVWGPSLMGVREDWTEEQQSAFFADRVRRLTEYIESIQASPGD